MNDTSNTLKNDHDLQLARTERLLGTLLQWGVWGSLVIILIGAVLCFARDPAYQPQPFAVEWLIAPQSAYYDSIGKVLSGILRLEGQAVMMAGAVLLISTPALRVAVSLLIYMRQRDRAYTLLTAAVLLLLLWGYFKKQDKHIDAPPSGVPRLEPNSSRVLHAPAQHRLTTSHQPIPLHATPARTPGTSKTTEPI
jgi:uncharacterized membrane protein